MTQISVDQQAELAGLLETVGPSADGHKVDSYEVEDDVEGEQETLPDSGEQQEALLDSEGPSQISDVLTTVGEASRAVKDKTDADYRR